MPRATSMATKIETILDGLFTSKTTHEWLDY